MNMKMLAAFGTVLGVLTAAGTTGTLYWDRFGWETPDQHAADMDLLREFRDEWRCDEMEEALLELLEEQHAGDDSVETQHKIDRIRKKMEKIDCSRFEDFD